METLPENTQEQKPEAVGTQLKALREAQGLTLEDVAGRLKISMRQLQAIEDNRFHDLPGAPFVRGFVRNYARFLNLDETSLLEQLESAFPSSAKATPTVTEEFRQEPIESLDGTGLPIKKMMVAIIGVLVIGGAVYFYAGNHEQGDATVASEAASGTSAQMVELSPLEASLPTSAAESSVSAATSNASAPIIDAAPINASVPVEEASTPVVVAGMAQVGLSAAQDSWVSVVDAHGKKLMYGTLQAGQSVQLSGQPPFQVKLGNAPKVKLTYNGHSVDFSNKIKGLIVKIELK